jgi:hypothetical protein
LPGTAEVKADPAAPRIVRRKSSRRFMLMSPSIRYSGSSRSVSLKFTTKESKTRRIRGISEVVPRLRVADVCNPCFDS